MKILKKLTAASLILATTVNMCLPIFSRASYVEKIKEEIMSNSFSSSIVNNIADREERKYSKAYQEYLKLSDEEKANIAVIPRKYDIPFDELYNIIEKQENSESNLLVENNGELVGSSGVVNDTTIPTVYDLRDDINIKVENQGEYGLCWAFAANTVLETNLALNENINKDFSELHVDYLTSTEFNYNTVLQRELHNGGNFAIYLEYLSKNKGPVLEDIVPYNGEYDIDSYDELLNLVPQAYVRDAVSFPTVYKEEVTEEELNNYRTSVKQHIMTEGALSANVNMDYGYNYYTNALNNTDTYMANHAITLIGWDDTYSKENFAEGYQPQEDGAYIALNSWGEEFGDSGIFYISYEDILVDTYVCGLVGAATEGVANDIVKFEDINLYNAIKSQFEEYIISCDDTNKIIELNSLTNTFLFDEELNLSGLNIENIAGLEYFNFFTQLDLSDNSITDITPIKDFQYLWSLDLSNNPLESDLSLIPNSDIINLSNCGLTSIDNLISEEKTRDYLSELNLSDNDIIDVSNLCETDSEGNNHYYTEIDLSRNKNLDLSTLMLSTSILKLEDCNITEENLDFLDNIYVEELDIAYNNISDISMLIDRGIWALDISYTNIEILPELEGLSILKASGNPNIEGLENLIDLSELTLRECNFDSLDKVQNLTQLYKLDLSDNSITDLNSLMDFQGLGILILDNNNVDINTIPYLEGLSTLSLNNNNIDDISVLPYISEYLWEIYLANNNITDMYPVSQLSSEYLEIDLSNNQISEFIMNEIDYNINLDNNEIFEIPEEISTVDSRITLKNQNTVIDNLEFEINQENFVNLPGAIAKVYNERYKTDANIITENCTIDYESGNIIVEPTTHGENSSRITIEKGGIFTGSIYTLNYNVAEDVEEEITITGIEVAETGTTTYIEGEDFDTTGLIINAIYSDGTIEEIYGYEIVNGQNLQLGQDSVIVRYNGYETLIDIIVEEIEEELTIIGIEIAETGTTTYNEGEDFDATELVVNIVYSDGTTEEITDYEIVDGENLQLGQETVTIRYGEHEAYVDVIVNEIITITGIDVEQTIARIYLEGDDFNPEGLVVNIVYSDGTTEEITDYEIVDGENLQLGQETVTIRYGDYEEYVSIIVRERVTIVGIEVAETGTTTYNEGEDFDTTGVVVNIVYSDGTTEEITDYEVVDGQNLQLGQETVTIRYGDYETIIAIIVEEIVEEATIVGIEVENAKTTYVEGEDFDTTELVVNVVYSDGTTEEITDYEIIDGENLQLGQETVTVRYDDYEVTIDIIVEEIVEEVTVVGIEVENAKTTYVEGEDFDTTELVVNVVYSDGTTEEITDYEVVNGENLQLGQEIVTIRYGQYEIDVNIIVNARITGIEIAETGKTTYTEGENFDPTGLVVNVVYSDGTTEEITDYEIVDGENLQLGQNTVTVTYEGYEANIDITVEEAVTVVGIEVAEAGRTIYTEGENFDTTGLVVNLVYSDGTTEEITDYEIIDGENLQEGQESVTVKYGNYEIIVSITVEGLELYGIEIVQGARINYIEGENFDTTGLVVRAIYGNSIATVFEIIDDYEIIGGENLQVGQDSVIIRYDEYEVYADVNVYSQDEVEEITFNDENLFRIMLNMILQQDAETKVISINEAEKKIVIVKEALEEITHVSMYDIEITDLTGLSKFYNIQELNLTNYNGEFLTELQRLSNLETLSIMVYEKEDLSDFESLTNLNVLNIWNGPVSNIGNILENLEYFNLTSSLSIASLDYEKNKIYMPQVITEMINFIEEPTIVVLNEYEQENKTELELQKDGNGEWYVEIDINLLTRILEDGDPVICIEISDEHQNYFVMCNISYEEIEPIYEYEVTNEFVLGINPKTPIEDFKTILLKDEEYNVIVKENTDVEEETTSEYVKTGMIIVILDSNNEIVAELTAIVKGDINGTGKADGNDWLILKGYRNEVIEFTPAQFEAADLNDDGAVNFTDSKLLLLHRTEVKKYDLNHR